MKKRTLWAIIAILVMALSMTACDGPIGVIMDAVSDKGDDDDDRSSRRNRDDDDDDQNRNDNNNNNSNNNNNNNNNNNSNNNNNNNNNNNDQGDKNNKSDKNDKKNSAKAHSVWVGDYVFISSRYDYNSDSYIDQRGVMSISLGDDMQIVCDYEDTEATATYTFKETAYDEAHYDYGDVLEAEATVVGSTPKDAKLVISQDSDDAPHVYYEWYTEDGYYTSCNLIKIENLDDLYAAPAGYDDSDRYGDVAKILSNPSDPLYPTSDNYMIRVERTTDYEYDYDTESYNEYPVTRIATIEFDANDMSKSKKEKYIYDDEASAVACYDYKTQWGSTSYTRDGKVVYYDDANYFYSKQYWLEYNSLKGYNGVHYAYQSKSNIQYYEPMGYYYYAYCSKPITMSSKAIDLDAFRMFLNVPNGTHKCMDTKDMTMYVYVNANDGSYEGLSSYAYVDFDCYLDGYDVYISDDESRYVGNGKFTGVRYVSPDYSGQGYIMIFEVQFSESEAVVTGYKYFSDDLSSTNVTLDNYMSIQADEVITHRYDMTKVFNNY